MQLRLEQLTGIAPNSRQQSKTVNIKAHFRYEQSCIDEFEVRCLTKQSKWKENVLSMAIISSLYKAYRQKDKRAERYTIFQPRIKS